MPPRTRSITRPLGSLAGIALRQTRRGIASTPQAARRIGKMIGQERQNLRRGFMQGVRGTRTLSPRNMASPSSNMPAAIKAGISKVSSLAGRIGREFVAGYKENMPARTPTLPAMPTQRPVPTIQRPAPSIVRKGSERAYRAGLRRGRSGMGGPSG